MNGPILGGSVLLASLVVVPSSFGNVLTNGINGINSSSLGLTGAGVTIGQVEPFRPGDPSFDTIGSLFHSSVNPAQVFFRNTTPTLNFNATMDDSTEIIDPNATKPGHSVWVAGIMVSTDTTDPDGPGPMVALTGVATGANLYSIGDNGAGPDFDPESAISTQHIAIIPGANVRTINMSFGNPLVGGHILDGNQLLTQFIDWSATQPQQDILYVVAGNEGTGGIPVPTDNFNGMTVAYSERVGNVWRRVGSMNNFLEDAEVDRTSIDLIAPGDGFEMTSLGTMPTTAPHPIGTSFAAPHVTGTAALL